MGGWLVEASKVHKILSPNVIRRPLVFVLRGAVRTYK